jgi:hypothetical protein
LDHLLPQEKAIIVMAYGVRERPDPARDPVYSAYTCGILNHADMESKRGGGHSLDGVPIYIPGGATDPSLPDITEAESLRSFFQYFDDGRHKLHIHPHGLDAREALEGLSEVIPGEVRFLAVYAAYTHCDLVRCAIRRAFPAQRTLVIPREFPQGLRGSAAVWKRLLRVPRTLLGVAGYYSESVRNLERDLRADFMRKHAAHPERLL